MDAFQWVSINGDLRGSHHSTKVLGFNALFDHLDCGDRSTTQTDNLVMDFHGDELRIPSLPSESAGAFDPGACEDLLATDTTIYLRLAVRA